MNYSVKKHNCSMLNYLSLNKINFIYHEDNN